MKKQSKPKLQLIKSEKTKSQKVRIAKRQIVRITSERSKCYWQEVKGHDSKSLCREDIIQWIKPSKKKNYINYMAHFQEHG